MPADGATTRNRAADAAERSIWLGQARSGRAVRVSQDPTFYPRRCPYCSEFPTLSIDLVDFYRSPLDDFSTYSILCRNAQHQRGPDLSSASHSPPLSSFSPFPTSISPFPSYFPLSGLWVLADTHFLLRLDRIDQLRRSSPSSTQQFKGSPLTRLPFMSGL